MGNDIQSQEMDRFYHRFSVIHRDPTKNLMYMEEKVTGKQYVLRELTTNDEIQKRRIEMLVHEKRTKRNKFLLRLEDHFFERDKSYCSNQFKAYLLFESHYKDLREEMLDRRFKKSYFEDDELLSILESGCMALKYLREINQPHEAVCSDNILINKDGVIMLSDPWLNSNNTNNALTSTRIYLSPQKLETINNFQTEGYDWYTSDLFSLGMVLLEAANLEFVDDVYKPSYRDINYMLLETKLQAIKNPIVRNYVQKLLRGQKQRLQVVHQIDYQVKRGIKPNLSKQENVKRVQILQRPETHHPVFPCNVVSPVQQVQHYTMSMPQNIHENRIVQNQIVMPQTYQPQALVYKHMTSMPTPTNSQQFNGGFSVQNHKQQNMTLPISHYPSPQKKPRQKEVALRMSKDGAQSTRTYNNGPVQPNRAVTPHSQTSRMFSKNFQVRSRLIEAEKIPQTNPEIKFNYAPNTQSPPPNHFTLQKNELVSNTVINNGKQTVQTQPLPNFTKPSVQNKVNVTFNSRITNTNPNHIINHASKNISMPSAVAGNVTPSAVNALGLGTTTSSHIFSVNSPPVYQATPINGGNVALSASQGHSFIKKVPRPTVVPSIVGATPSLDEHSAVDSTEHLKTIRRSGIFNATVNNDYVAPYQSIQTSSSASKLQQLLRSPMSAADAELFTKPQLLSREYLGLSGLMKKTTDTLYLSTSKQPQAYSYKMQKLQHPVPNTQFNAYEYFLDRQTKYDSVYDKGYRESDKKSEDQYITGYTGYDKIQDRLHTNLNLNPTETYTQQKFSSDLYTYNPANYDYYKASDPLYTHNAYSVSTPASELSVASPFVPTLSLTTAVTTPTIQSDRTYKVQQQFDLKKFNEQYGINDRAAKTQRVQSKNTGFEYREERHPQKDKEFLKSTVVTNFEIDSKEYNQTDPIRADPSSVLYKPSYEIPHPSIFEGRVDQSPNQQKYLLSYDLEVDNSRQAKSSIAQDSALNNSSKSLINAINMTEPSVPVYTQQTLSITQVPKPISPGIAALQSEGSNQDQLINSQQFEGAQNQEPQQGSTPARPKGTQVQKYNSTIAEVSQSQNSAAQDEQSQYVVEEYQVGSRYQGYKKNGMRNGKGKFYYQDGGFYEGQWKDNKMHGEGKLYYNESKLAYEGEWYLDQFHGHGKVYNDNPIVLEEPFNYKDFDQLDQYWVYYEGNLVTDTKEGLGKLKLSNGQIFEGEFKYDRIEGKGKFVTISGEIISGIWRDSKLLKVL